MGWLDDAKGAVNKAAKDLGIKSPFDADTTVAATLEAEYVKQFKADGGQIWTVKGADWYQVYGYQFVISTIINQTSTDEGYKFTLPIPPQSFMVKPVMASRATPTIGGVVEETSSVVFWMIQMQGTTGIAVVRGEKDGVNRAEMAQSFRDNITTTGLLSGVAANLNKTISKIGGVADKVIDAFGNVSSAIDSGDTLGAVSNAAEGFIGAANTAILPSLPYSTSAVKQSGNGFTEAQELQKYFYMYSKLKGKFPNNYSLKFRCYKTNQEWDVIVKDFSLQISAQNPNLYKYSISLQGWNCRPVGTEEKKSSDRFGEKGDLKSVNTLTTGAATKVLSSLSTKKILGF